MRKIMNLTQHPATEGQIKEGVFDLQGEPLERLKKCLTFNTLPSPEDLKESADTIAALVLEHRESTGDSIYHCMIGGAPYLMPYLERALIKYAIKSVYAFSVRDSVEEVQPDGSVRKVNVFVHAGLVGYNY